MFTRIEVAHVHPYREIFHSQVTGLSITHTVIVNLRKYLVVHLVYYYLVYLPYSPLVYWHVPHLPKLLYCFCIPDKSITASLVNRFSQMFTNNIFKPPPPVGAGGGYMFSGRPSVPLSVHP